MGFRRDALVLLAFSFYFWPSCDSDRISSATLLQIRQAHARMLTVDAHIDASLLLRGSKDSQALFRRMKADGIDAAIFMIPAGEGDHAAGAARAARESIEAAIDRIRRQIERSAGEASLALTPADAYRLEKEGRIAAFIGLGGGEAVGNDVRLVRAFYDRGVRLLSISGEADNRICDSATDQSQLEDRGLSEFGREVVAECNRVGMMIDVSGCSERSFFDVLEASRAPVVAARTAARALLDRPDNPSDGMIRALAERGGAVLVCLVPERLGPAATRAYVSVADVADHIDHVRRLAGVEAVGIGSGFGEGGGFPGVRNPGGMLRLTIELLRRGYGENETEAVWGGNIMRVLEHVAVIAGER